MKKNISFITVASGEVGMGHLIRSLSLADLLCQHFNIHFIVETDNAKIIQIVKGRNYAVDKLDDALKNNDLPLIISLVSKADIIVLDFYTITEEFQLALKRTDVKLVCIDDLHKVHFYSDVVMNVSNGVKESDYSCEKATKLLLGTNYVLLRSEFLRSALLPARNLTEITSVFINMGGADLPNNTLKFLKAISAIDELKKIHVVLGPVNPHEQSILQFIKTIKQQPEVFLYKNIEAHDINELLGHCHLAISPASGVSMEICAVGIGLVTGFTVDNQKDLLNGIIKACVATNLNDFNLLSESDIYISIKEVLGNKAQINKMITRQKVLIDGKSPSRIKKVFQSL